MTQQISRSPRRTLLLLISYIVSVIAIISGATLLLLHLYRPQVQADKANNLPVHIALTSALEFKNNTKQFAGSVCRLAVFPERGSIPKGETLQVFSGKTTNFYFAGKVGGVVRIEIPNEIPLPNTIFPEIVVIEFHCGEGDAKKGNRAIFVNRITSIYYYAEE